MSLESDITSRLSGNETYWCLLTVPWIGSKTAAVFMTMVDVSLFGGDDRLSSYCGLAPTDNRSGTSIDSTCATRFGNKQLKNLLVFSCNSLIGTTSRSGRYYEEHRSRDMRHNKAHKAVARKRLGVIYAIMRDQVPYEEPSFTENVQTLTLTPWQNYRDTPA